MPHKIMIELVYGWNSLLFLSIILFWYFSPDFIEEQEEFTLLQAAEI